MRKPYSFKKEGKAMSKIIASFVILILLFPNFTPVSAQVIQPIYQSPLPGAEFVSAGTTIAVRYGPEVNPGSIQDNLFSVNGSESGVHPGKVVLAQDAETVIFKPDAPFTPGKLSV